MKKFYILTALLCCLFMTATAQTKQRVMIPGKGNIDVEQLNSYVQE